MRNKKKENLESVQGVVNDFRFFLNTHSSSKNFTNARLSACLEILCSQRASLSILPIGRKKCLICKHSLKNGEQLFKFPCECFYDMHYDCFNQNPFKYFSLSSNGFMKCRTCKLKYHISEDYYEQSTLLQQSLLKSTIKPKFEEHKAEVFHCKICEEDRPAFVKLDCSHKFCQHCLRQYITNNLQQNKFSLQNLICPEELCKKPMTFKLIQKILMKNELEHMESKILSFNPENFLKKNEKVAMCPKANCDFFFIMKKNDMTLKIYNCPKCNEEFCVNGCPELHPGMTCQQYKNIMKEEGKEFVDVVKKNNIKICEKCGAWIEKNKGCNHITCKCKYEFCYICGKKWKKCQCPLFGVEGSDEDENDGNAFVLRRFGMQHEFDDFDDL